MWSKPFESLKLCVAGLVLGTWAFSAASSSQNLQNTAKIDFSRDVLPIFRQNCFGCHGPTQQMNGFRLDRRRDALRGGTIAVIAPSNSAGSRLYHKLIGNKYGPQ